MRRGSCNAFKHQQPDGKADENCRFWPRQSLAFARPQQGSRACSDRSCRSARRARYRLMDEEYTVVSPFTLWRRRLLIAAMIIPFLALVWGGEVLFDSWRVNSGPSAWFMVSIRVGSVRVHGAPQSVISDSFTTERECNNELSKMPSFPGAPILGCRRLLVSDAAQMRRY